jgi:hypothetical protein
MKRDWDNLDINQLQHLYKQNAEQLEYRLLRGASWQEVNDQRRDVTELAIEIFQRLNPTSFFNPSEHPQRKKE